jgi:hypothetical protein
MQLRSITRRFAALGLVAALALVLAVGQASFAGAQATPDATPAVGGDTALPETGAGTTSVSQATPAVGGDTALPETGAGTTALNQATPAVGGDTTLPSTGTGSAAGSGMTGLMAVLAAAAAVVVAAVAARTFMGRRTA